MTSEGRHFRQEMVRFYLWAAEYFYHDRRQLSERFEDRAAQLLEELDDGV